MRLSPDASACSPFVRASSPTSSGASSRVDASSSPLSAEVGGRPGRVHDEVARIQQQWRDLLGREASAALDQGELPVDTDPQQLAFELGVILAGTNIVSVLHDDLAVIDRARSAVKSRLCSESSFRTTA